MQVVYILVGRLVVLYSISCRFSRGVEPKSRLNYAQGRLAGGADTCEIPRQMT